LKYKQGFDKDQSLLFQTCSNEADNYGKMCVKRRPWANDNTPIPGFAWDILSKDDLEVATVEGTNDCVLMAVRNNSTGVRRSIWRGYVTKPRQTKEEFQRELGTKETIFAWSECRYTR
jgi:hypothetical protein